MTLKLGRWRAVTACLVLAGTAVALVPLSLSAQVKLAAPTAKGVAPTAKGAAKSQAGRAAADEVAAKPQADKAAGETASAKVCLWEHLGKLPPWYGEACTVRMYDKSLSSKQRIEAWNLRAEWYLLRGDHTQAYRDFTALLKKHPDNARATRRLANIIGQSTGDYETMEALLQRALKLDPKDADTQISMGNLYVITNRFKQALTAYGTAIKLKPEWVNSRYARAKLFKRLRRFDEALKDTAHLLRQPDSKLDKLGTRERFGVAVPLRLATQFLHGDILRQAQRFDEAERWYDKLVADHKSAVTLIARAKFLYGMPVGGAFKSRNSEALRDTKEAAALQPDLTQAHSLYARLLYYKGRTQEALDEQDLAITLYKIWRLKMSKGMKQPNPLLKNDRSSKAVNRLPLKLRNSVLTMRKLVPQHTALREMPSLLWWRALMLRKLGRVDEAIKTAKETMRLAQRGRVSFAIGRMQALAQMGYYRTPQTRQQMPRALTDAVEACMMDERCF